MKFKQFIRSTVALAGFLACLGQALAVDAVQPQPVAVAVSESFEVVGRLEEGGFVFYIDRAETNAPVLGASLEVELAGKSVPAVFQPEQGNYRVADTAWLQALRQPGHYPLGLTLIAGEESDLLSADFEVTGTSTAGDAADGSHRGFWIAGGLLGLLAALGWHWRKGARA